MRLDLFVKLKYESSKIILFVGIRYSMRDLCSDLNNYRVVQNNRMLSFIFGITSVIHTDCNHSFTVTSRNLWRL